MRTHDEAELTEKYYELTSRLIEHDTAADLHEGIMHLEEIADIRNLLRPLSAVQA